MKCIKCREENINKANYCKKCKYHFTKQEQECAHKKTLPGKLELFEKAYSVCTLKVITDNIIFKIATLLIVIGVCISFYISNGSKFKILESPNYQIQYNTKLKEYYIITNKDSVKLNFYKPNSIKNFSIVHLDKDNNKISNIDYQDNKEIILNTNYEDDYYLLNMDDNQKIKVYIFKGEV